MADTVGSSVIQPAADVWSVGCCLYEFALASRLFEPAQRQDNDEGSTEGRISKLIQECQDYESVFDLQLCVGWEAADVDTFQVDTTVHWVRAGDDVQVRHTYIKV